MAIHPSPDIDQPPATAGGTDLTSIDFQLNATEGEARSTTLTTRRGVIETPVFMPVGTAGTVKGIRFEELESPGLDARIILGNTYHLWLRPGIEIDQSVRRFAQSSLVGTARCSLIPAGFKFGASRATQDHGRRTGFDHVDGSLCFLSPEVSMEVQTVLGAEIAMAFDECAPGQASYDEARRSMELTLRWAQRSKDAFEKLHGGVFPLPLGEGQGEGLERANPSPPSPLPAGEGGKQALFGIVQGASHLDLRRESLERTVEIGFDGYAIGGLSVGEEKHVMMEVIEEIAPRMPADKPRYLMGVGTPEDLIEAVARGVDMFDCVLPTRNGATARPSPRAENLISRMPGTHSIRSRWTNHANARFVGATRGPSSGTYIYPARCWPVSC
jgi:queuine tRNA-ribosyltransferase